MLNPNILSLAFGHATVDMFGNLLPMMYPLLIASLHLDYGLIGLIVVLTTCSSSLSQPIFGFLADRFGGRYMAALGIAWVATLLAMLSFAWDYWSFLIIITLSGFGIAAFHPQGAMNASEFGGERKSSAMSIYTLGGSVGFALGPVIGAAVLSTSLGLRGAALLWIPGLLAAFWVFKIIGKVDVNRKALREQVKKVDNALPQAKMPLVGIVAVVCLVMLRSWVMTALNNYTPLLFAEQGQPLDWASEVLFVLLISMAIGGVIGGIVADQIGGKKVVFWTLLVAGPVVYLYLQSVGPLAFLSAALAGLLLGASNSVTLVMGQQLLPRSAGMASGLILGFAFATGGAGTNVTGFMADRMGLLPAMTFLCILPVVAALVTLALRKPERQGGDVKAF